ncbi:MAG: hypothetical protein H6702_17755 [Myxococcales bacterium]|nr:hypothetical protein [Myxococcales bacterium]
MNGCVGLSGELDGEGALRRVVRQLCAPLNDHWRQAAAEAFVAAGGPPPGPAPADQFFTLWAACDFAPQGHPLARVVANGLADRLPPAQRAALAALAVSPPRLLWARRVGEGRILVDALSGQHWPTALAALVPDGGAALTRLLWRPGIPRQIGPFHVLGAGAPAEAARAALRQGAGPRPWRAPVATWRRLAPALYAAHKAHAPVVYGDARLRPWAVAA